MFSLDTWFWFWDSRISWFWEAQNSLTLKVLVAYGSISLKILEFSDSKILAFSYSREEANACHLWGWGSEDTREWQTAWTFSPTQSSTPAVRNTAAPVGTYFISLKPEAPLGTGNLLVVWELEGDLLAWGSLQHLPRGARTSSENET